ncbi:23S rRNA (pseudouridine(1915)-N(3))-methyltransferase RlmH [Dongia sp.]|jgi:23S rRNA (pseudouridine1915-N3)-methyltransferase|uniref:23S rRNA (pseudouridine(1915)-N(3))-methyltransferase RlmH n=1 Tax=Dongia sp. TaxID=1977262 RepID=UPI0035AE09DA
MKIRIIALGRAKAGPEKSLVETYKKRLTWPCDIVELEAKKGIAGAELMAAEADLIDKALAAKASSKRVVIALDERGQNLSSRDFAKRITALGNQGYSELVFVIGGADGLAPMIRERAGLLLSFGTMTWPHMLVRVLLMEQIYRAQTIIAGHPYHRD